MCTRLRKMLLRLGIELDGKVLGVASAPLQTSFNGFEVWELSRWMVWTSLGLCTKPGGNS